MHTERRAEGRHFIPSLWVTVGRTKERCEIYDIGRANARIRDAAQHLKAGSLHKFTVYIPMFLGKPVPVALWGTVTRLDGNDVALTYDPPTSSWWQILDTLSRHEMSRA